MMPNNYRIKNIFHHRMRTIVLLCLVAQFCCGNTIKQMLREDPNQDIFEQMDHETKEEWSHNYDLTLTERTLQLMTPIEEVIQIQVILVGFRDKAMTTNKLAMYLDRLKHRVPVHVIKSQRLTGKQIEDEFDPSTDFDHSNKVDTIMKAKKIREGGTGNILVDRVVHYKVVESSKTLEKEFKNAISRFKAPQIGSPITIPYSSVDDLVEDDYQKELKRFGQNSISVYIFNSSIPQVPYYYSNSGEYDGCTGVSQVGDSRWIWLDLNAGPVSWGPKFAGEGLVSGTTLPHIPNYYKENTLKSDELLSDLAAWVRRSAELLVCPAVDHLPYLLSPSRDPERTVVQLVMFHDHPVGETEKYGMFKADIISKAIQQFPALPGQTFLFASEDISLQDDVFAASVYQNSLRDYVYVDSVENNQTLYHSQQYLNSKSLHYWLGRFQRNFFPSANSVHYVPVFIFDFSYTGIMLLDRKEQVVSYPDMVIAVQTEEENVRLPFICNRRVITTDGRNVTREILGSLIQSLWGVLPTGQFWSESHQRVEHDFLWNMGRTPFGPFSDSTEFSFVQSDGIYKPQLYQLINQTITHVLNPMLKVKSYGYQLYHLLDEHEYDEFVIRWNLFRFKLKECGEEMALHEWANAYHYVRSAYKDSEALLKLLTKAQDSISFILQCDHNPPKQSWTTFLISSFSVLVAIVLCFYLLYSKRSTFNQTPSAKKYD